MITVNTPNGNVRKVYKHGAEMLADYLKENWLCEDSDLYKDLHEEDAVYIAAFILENLRKRVPTHEKGRYG